MTIQAIGIDLGTTFSAVAFIDETGRPTMVNNASGETTTPSVVLLGDEEAIVGREALQEAAMEPDGVAECVKRDMGSANFRKLVCGKKFPPEVLSSFILKKLKLDAERRLGKITHAVITVPAFFDEPRRRATINAGKLAGLEVLDIVNEPTAAAIAFGYQSGFISRKGLEAQGDPLTVLVFDLGGGTFDVTIMKIASDSFRAIATDGDTQLGGKDWDQKLVDIAAERFIAEHREDPRENPSSLHDLYQSVESAKKTLSERSKATLIVNHLGIRFKTVITREEFEEATRSLLERTRSTTEIVLLKAGMSWNDIDKVLLVGGSTRMCMVVEMLREISRKEPDCSISPDEAVAQGAALFADLLMKKKGIGVGQNNFSVVNVNSHSLGVEVIKADSKRRQNRIFIPKNTPLPAKATRRLKTMRDNQDNVSIRVLEGESEQPESCTTIGKCIVKVLSKNLPAGWPVEVTYRYNENGCLTVKATIPGTKNAATVEFVRDNTLTDDDLLLWGKRLAEQYQQTDQ